MLRKMTGFVMSACLMWACQPAEPTTPADHAAAPAPSLQTQPQSQPQSQPASRAAGTPSDADLVNALLDKLEKNAADLQAFTAKIAYEKEDAVLGRNELRTGELIYRLDPKTGEKSFAALFDSTIINGTKRNSPMHYIFNGRWLAEIDQQKKQFIKREIVPPGKQLDPLKLGEGPFPLPIGQPKSEVLARFDVTMMELPKEGLLKDLKDVDGLLLVPKAGTKEARDFARVGLFYDRKTLLPVGINAIEKNNDRKTIRLSDVQRNPSLTEDDLQKLNIQEPDARQWHIDVRPWQESGESPR